MWHPTHSRGLFLLAIIAAMCLPMETSMASGSQATEPKAMDISYCGQKPGRPPLKYLRFNLTLRNQGDQPRWFLLPSSLYDRPSALPKDAGIYSVEAFESPSVPKVRVALFLGNFRLQPEGAGGFKALLLPAHAEITLRNFGISFWGETGKPLPVLLIIADQITIDGQSIIQWLGTDLLSNAKADVQADHLERGKSRST